MAPGLLFDDNDINNNVINRNGLQLEETSDDIDTVNILKDQLKQQQQQQQQKEEEEEEEWTEKSKFDTEKDKSQFRQYYTDACSRVRDFYTEQHTKQTVSYNLSIRQHHFSPSSTRPEIKMSIWQAMEKLDTLIDDSDPDASALSQIHHLLQSAEAIRRDGKPRWMQLTGLIHDLGKLLYFHGSEGQWDVVGDTFPVGCAFDLDAIIYPDTFSSNPDVDDAVYSTRYGIYSPNCGLDNVMLSWGHDEYLYHVVKNQSVLPDEALAMIRYHSFYPWHKEGGYRYLMDEHDERMLEAVRAFNPYDLYSKSDGLPDVEELKPYYLELIDEFFPQRVIRW
ncbi:DUF706-domain-containing protein [Poronia punctata]|nr:DUF706-domain-containing protein [Poronia punctata]